MTNSNEKDTIDLICNEQVFPEFPNLLFGTTIDDGTSFFDATLYLIKSESEETVEDFFTQYFVPIRALCNAYEKPLEAISRTNKQGHTIIDGNFVYLFISFVEPNFLAFICDRIHELMIRGVAVSDSYLLQSASERLPKEVLIKIIENNASSK